MGSIPDALRSLIPDGWLKKSLVDEEVVSLCACGKLTKYANLHAMGTAKAASHKA